MIIDWQLLWNMGGHGPYVWGSYAIALTLLAAEALALWNRSRARHHTPVQTKLGKELT